MANITSLAVRNSNTGEGVECLVLSSNQACAVGPNASTESFFGATHIWLSLDQTISKDGVAVAPHAYYSPAKAQAAHCQ